MAPLPWAKFELFLGKTEEQLANPDLDLDGVNSAVKAISIERLQQDWEKEFRRHSTKRPPEKNSWVPKDKQWPPFLRIAYWSLDKRFCEDKHLNCKPGRRSSWKQNSEDAKRNRRTAVDTRKMNPQPTAAASPALSSSGSRGGVNNSTASSVSNAASVSNAVVPASPSPSVPGTIAVGSMIANSPAATDLVNFEFQSAASNSANRTNNMNSSIANMTNSMNSSIANMIQHMQKENDAERAQETERRNAAITLFQSNIPPPPPSPESIQGPPPQTPPSPSISSQINGDISSQKPPVRRELATIFEGEAEAEASGFTGRSTTTTTTTDGGSSFGFGTTLGGNAPAGGSASGFTGRSTTTTTTDAPSPPAFGGNAPAGGSAANPSASARPLFHGSSYSTSAPDPASGSSSFRFGTTFGGNAPAGGSAANPSASARPLFHGSSTDSVPHHMLKHPPPDPASSSIMTKLSGGKKTWECCFCRLRNTDEACVSCEKPRDNLTVSASTGGPGNPFSFPPTATSSFSFPPPTATTSSFGLTREPTGGPGKRHATCDSEQDEGSQKQKRRRYE